MIHLNYTDEELATLRGVANIMKKGNVILIVLVGLFIFTYMPFNVFADSDDLSMDTFIVIRVSGAVDITVQNNGEKLSSEEQQMEAVVSFGRMDIIGENGSIKMFCIDPSDDYQINIKGNKEGLLDYTVRFFYEGDLLDEREFVGIEVNEKTLITTGTVQSSKTKMLIDIDGDGETDQTLEGGKNKIVNRNNQVWENPNSKILRAEDEVVPDQEYIWNEIEKSLEEKSFFEYMKENMIFVFIGIGLLVGICVLVVLILMKKIRKNTKAV